jgi:plastocyanin
MRRIAVMAAVAALVFAGCGGDDEEPAGSESTPAAETTPSPSPEATEEASGGGSSTLAIEADPSGENAFTETELTATAGQVTLEFSNPSESPHAVVIEGVEPSTETVTNSDAPPITVDLEAGEYTFFCPVGNHRDDGMEGTLTVS